jgi:undecaprenyl diphosphate synthase
MDQTETLKPPVHLGLILDGNRRWARLHTIPEMDGHLAGYNALKEVLDAAYDNGIKYVTIYAFSAENWSRPEKEVSSLMNLAIRAIKSDLKRLVDRGVKVRFLSRRDTLSPKVLEAIDRAEETTSGLTKATLAVCFNYGGQQEIVDAAKKCIEDGLSIEDITLEAMSQRMYAPEIPPLDFIVRTSGEQRLSNFMLWRAAYSDFYFIDKYWPDMTKDDVIDIIKEYNKRQRRFGV